jgi:DNA/RNA endonuclease G (NUC1)|tara:strand:- start:28 stop:303 length:276 start_codon:yes stop_codon:yes gene_type:complete
LIVKKLIDLQKQKPVKIAISKDTKFAKWVAYKVESKNLNGSSKSRNFKQDPKLDNDIALSSKDYKDAYQRRAIKPIDFYQTPHLVLFQKSL